MVISHYTADSFLIGLFNSRRLAMTISKETFPNFPIDLTTTYFDGLLPGLADKYGYDQDISIEAVVTKIPTSLFEKGLTGIKTNLDLVFKVGDEVAIVVTLIDMDVKVRLTLEKAELKV